MGKLAAMWLVVVAVGLGGCCGMQKDGGGVKPTGPLPAAISLGEQLEELNARARAMPVLRAKGTVVVRYVDDAGNAKQDSADGTLLVRQRYGVDAAQDPADVYLQGRVAGQEVFQSAKNQQKWWFISRDKKGWMGDVTGVPDFSGREGGGVMRADLMLQVLAITEIQPHEGETIAMKVHDSTRSNDIEILRLRRDGTAWVKRELIVDRDSREVRQVTLGDPAGRLAVRAELKNYEPVSNGGRFPRDIWVTYPSQKLSVHFAVDKVETLGEAPEAPFETPDFEDRGIELQK